MSEHHSGPYDDDKCHFCKKGAKNGVEHTAGFQRAEDSKPSGPFFDACESCARKPYPQPKQFENENKGE
jgi:hypothetical protein